MNSLAFIVLAVLGTAFVFQIFYWLWIMTRVRRGPRNLASALHPVSIIICARNEASNLQKLIPALLAQKYAAPKQIVIVDDCSADDTPLVIAQMRAQYPEIYTTTIPGDKKFKHGKKLAITVGIKAAKHQHLIFIDADCIPQTENWLTSVMEHYDADDTQLVIGYGRYAKHPGLLNLLIRYETFWNAVQFFGFAVAIKPFMGVGRNLSYTKELFDRSSKFRNNLNILSGDDDMLVCEMGTRANTAINFICEGQTVSEPAASWMAYSAQKTRHLSTSTYYPFVIKSLLGLELASRTFFWLALLASVVVLALHLEPDAFLADSLLWTSVGCLACRTIVMYVVLGFAARNMSESKMWTLALPFDVIIPLMQLSAWITGTLTQKRDTWK